MTDVSAVPAELHFAGPRSRAYCKGQALERAAKDAAMFLKRKKRHAGQTEHWINTSLELFDGLTRREIEGVRRYFTAIDVNEGQTLGLRGSQCRYFAVVLTGQVAISFHDTPVGVLTPGCFWGATALLAPDRDRRRHGSASALVDCWIAVADPREFSSLLSAFPLIAKRVGAMAHSRREYVEAVGKADFDTVVPISEIAYPIHVHAGPDTETSGLESGP